MACLKARLKWLADEKPHRVAIALRPRLRSVNSSPGSVVAFTTYLTVVHRLGPEKASYMTVLFPVVALTASIVVEHYQADRLQILGVAAILFGNVVVFAPRPLSRQRRLA